MTDSKHVSDVLQKCEKGGLVILGNFDGLHRGHQAVIDAATAKAKAFNVAAHALTLEPHPRTLFQPDLPNFRLTPAAVKVRWLHHYGLQDVIILPFSRALSEMSAEDFISQILINGLQARHVVAGFDFAFGHNRVGTMSYLREQLARHDIGVTEVAPARDLDGQIYSATRARDALRAGDIKTATEILGRYWTISGTVIKGDQRGRTIDVPTANITLGEYLHPRYGVYAVKAHRIGSDEVYSGVANIGMRPTVEGDHALLEVHLFDFKRDIYGEEWEITLIDFIRPEQRFAGLPELKDQIAADIDVAKGLFTAGL